MTSAIHTEWTKLRTLPSTWWLLVGVVVLTLAASAATTAGLAADGCAAEVCHEDLVRQSLTGVWLGQAAVVVLGALTISAEYGTGTIRASLTALPARLRLLTAKAVVVSGLALCSGSLAVLGALGAGRLLLPDGGFTEALGYPPIGLTDGPTLRAAAGSVLYFALVALLALGAAAALRDTAAAVTTVLGLLYAFPLLVGMVHNDTWHERLERLSPASAGLAVQATEGLDQLPIGPWQGLAVLAGYAAGGMVLGGVLLKARDV
ncbi:ABC transporter permease subunit [Streptomyces sp. NPDC127108]|uniref:ABC transporter permease subunit n=1 Tax=Streptomyces sp. NPDC127108 TaxID=3345361 RepID=UPI003641D0E0